MGGEEHESGPVGGGESRRHLSFHVVVSGAGAGGPAPDDTLARCQQWFEAHGASCHRIAAGLVCTMPLAGARQLFGTDLLPAAELPVPAELVDAVEAITVPAPPALFGPPPGD